ncbi:MAG: hypothetical protein HQL69_08835 [Magnetococcales bacterium]|nr:hypothetical protein [Magnetococcales bacterium]
MGQHWGWRNLQLAGWLAFFFIVMFQEADIAYLADIQVWILRAGAAMVTVVFLHSLLIRPKVNNGDPKVGKKTFWFDLIETGGHFAPLLLFLFVGTATLSLGSASGKGASIRVFMPDNVVEQPDFTTLKAGEYWPTTHIELYATDHFAAEAPIQVEGRFYPLSQKEQKKFITTGKSAPNVLAYRYAMACCAADAAPVSIVLDNIAVDAVKRDDWLRLKGRTFVYRQEPKIMGLKIESWEKIPPPKRPFLTWLQTIR